MASFIILLWFQKQYSIRSEDLHCIGIQGRRKKGTACHAENVVYFYDNARVDVRRKREGGKMGPRIPEIQKGS